MSKLETIRNQYLEKIALNKMRSDPYAGATLKISLTDAEDKKKSQATLLIEIGSQYTLFHCPQNDAYTEIIEQGVIKILPLRTRDYREFLGHEFFALTGKGAHTTALSDALNTLEAIAKHRGQSHPVSLRLAYLDDRIYIDMGCPQWRVIEVTKTGWRILDKSPVKFYRGAE
ncbi:MAG: hypothetical protein PHY16_18230 [Methylobacter sp.]|nr:hypothetical protein [Methylobacter sp.]